MPAPLQAPNSVAGRTLRGQPKVLCIQHPRNYTWHPAFDLIVARASPTHTGTRRAGSSVDACDLVLSSGFLAFAGHAGFLQAVEEGTANSLRDNSASGAGAHGSILSPETSRPSQTRQTMVTGSVTCSILSHVHPTLGLPVGGVMGTSAGALAGSLFCAGYTPRQVAKHLSDQTPASLLRPSLAPWRGGALSLDQVINRLKDLLPPTFEDLHREFAVGVVTSDGQHLLIDSGPLPEAVAASAAIPFVFQAVDVPGHVSRHGPFKDGGVVDRVGLKAWRDRRRAQIKSGKGPSSVARPPPPCLVHVIDRSSPFSGFDDTNAMGESSIMVIKSPRSGANFFDLGSFEEHMDAARNRARPLLAAFARRNYNGSRHSSSGGSGGGPGSSNGLIVEEATSVATASSEAVVRARII